MMFGQDTVKFDIILRLTQYSLVAIRSSLTGSDHILHYTAYMICSSCEHYFAAKIIAAIHYCPSKERDGNRDWCCEEVGALKTKFLCLFAVFV